MELINEPKAVTNDSDKPRAEGVTKATLREYYQLGYDAGRRYTSTAYVIFSARLSVYKGEMEFISLASGLSGTVIDVHYYNLYVDFFKTLTAQQNIDFVKTERAKELAAISPANGWPLSFVGKVLRTWVIFYFYVFLNCVVHCQENGPLSGRLRMRARATARSLRRRSWRSTGQRLLDGLTGLTGTSISTGASSG